jgi:hypothetical protein
MEEGNKKLEEAMNRIRSLESEIASLTPDNSNYEILDAQEVGCNLVVKVKYTGCKCSYQGVKIMVFLNTKAIGALKWKKLDPHFRDGMILEGMNKSPAARFPATKEGWEDAITYAGLKG